VLDSKTVRSEENHTVMVIARLWQSTEGDLKLSQVQRFIIFARKS